MAHTLAFNSWTLMKHTSWKRLFFWARVLWKRSNRWKSSLFYYTSKFNDSCYRRFFYSMSKSILLSKSLNIIVKNKRLKTKKVFGLIIKQLCIQRLQNKIINCKCELYIGREKIKKQKAKVFLCKNRTWRVYEEGGRGGRGGRWRPGWTGARRRSSPWGRPAAATAASTTPASWR